LQGLQKHLFLTYATSLSVLGLFASDMYIPALSSIRNHYETTSGMVGLSLSLYMVGFGVAQLFYGALSDQIGRKKPLLAGLGLFLISTIGCIYANTIETFIVFRLLQSIGVGAAYVLWQPMIIDIFKKEDVQKIFTLLMALGSISPAVAPLVGGYLSKWNGWQTVFWFISIMTMVLIVWTTLAYRESLNIHARQKFSLPKIISTYGYFLKDHFFIGYSMTIACGITLYFVFLTMLPFILSDIGYDSASIGLMYIPIVCAFIIGAQVCKKRYHLNGDSNSIFMGSNFAVFGAGLLFCTSIFIEITSAWQIILPVSFIAFGNGFIVPTGTAFLMKCYSDKSGSCASLIGFLTAITAFLSTSMASSMIDTLGIHSMAITILIFAVLMIISLYIGRKYTPIAHSLA